MGRLKRQAPVKLFTGFIFSDERILAAAQKALQRRFGPVDDTSAVMPFLHTAYYAREFGPGLKRQFAAFRKLIAPESLPDVKRYAQALELRFARGGSRSVNIDPGYLTLAKVVLATTKDYIHRLYLGKGIFAEVTLSYGDNSYRPREWTYPDYRSQEYVAFFNRIRSRYGEQIKNIGRL